MPEIKIHIENLDKFERALRTSPRTIARKTQEAIDEAGNIFLAATKENIRSGRNMWKPPIDTGYMWNHIFLNIFPLKAEIIPTADYAVYVHEGTSKMQSRPFLAITEESEAKRIEQIFEKHLNRAMDDIGRGV